MCAERLKFLRYFVGNITQFMSPAGLLWDIKEYVIYGGDTSGSLPELDRGLFLGFDFVIALTMGAHAAQIAPQDRWKIVMYIHQLQNDGASPLGSDSTATATKDSSKVTALAK